MSNLVYPILPLRDIVIFPHMIAPLFVGRSKSIKALELVMEENKEIISKDTIQSNHIQQKRKER